MIRTSLLIPLAFMLAAPVHAQRQLSLRFTEFTLDNGLHVILHKDNATPIVTVSVMYHVGSKDDASNRRGFAHFFEHLLFEGSKNIGRGEFAKLVEGAGGMLNANTTGDRTYYYEVLPSNQLELGLWLESERMRHATVDRKGIDTQREVVKEERRQNYENRPYGSILIEVLKRAYTKHPYRWPTIGFMEDLDAASEADSQEFYKRYYVPNNAVLVIAGDIDEADARKLVDKHFGKIPRGRDVERVEVREPPIASEIRDVVYDRVQLPAVVQAYRIPALAEEDFPAVDMVNRILSEGNSSRFNRVVKDEKQLAIYVGAFSLPFEHPGLAITFAIANMGVEPDALERAMDAEIDLIRKEGISAKELDKLKAQLETEHLQKLNRLSGVASELAGAHTFHRNAGRVNEELALYQRLTPEDIQRAAEKYFSKEHRVVLHYLPESSRP